MLIVLALALGAAVGWRRAAVRGGDRLDKLQYAAAHAIFFALVTLAGTILLGRLGAI